MANQDGFDEYTGEIHEAPKPMVVDAGALAILSGVEIDKQISTARAYPRSITRARDNIMALAIMDEETAAECCYVLVRRKKGNAANRQNSDENKPIEGPSIRLAEIAAQQWGNNRNGARIIEVNKAEKYVEAEGFFHDLETNMAIRATVRRRISTASGYVFSDDMITVTGNAACAIAKRNAILAGVPRGVVRPAYMKAHDIIAGTAESLTKNREKVFAAFATKAVTPEMICMALAIDDVSEIRPKEIATLRAMWTSLKNGDETVEAMFAPPKTDHEPVKNPLDDKPDDDGGATGAAPQTESKPNEDGTKPVDDFPGDKPTSSAIADARKKGADAFSKGLPRGAVPAGFKIEKRAAELDAWHEGFDEAKKVKDGEPL